MLEVLVIVLVLALIFGLVKFVKWSWRAGDRDGGR